MSKAKAEPKMKNRSSGNFDLNKCPICGSKNVSLVEFHRYYCLDCCVEFDKYGVYTIQWDGTLVDYYENEFASLV